MKLWKLTYEFSSVFSSPVTDHRFTLRFFPKESLQQKVNSFRLEIKPKADVNEGTDAFGNRLLLGNCLNPHDSFDAVMSAVISKANVDEAEPRSFGQLGMFRYETKLTKAEDNLLQFYRGIRFESEDPYLRAKKMMNELSGHFAYQSGSTFFNTTAEEALAQGCGVCQDYAHIMLALCRKDGITARYVAGVIPGEGQTHAWIEILVNHVWKGLDPTHNRETDDSYITFSLGRDAADCVLNKGIFRGGMEVSQEIYVKMEEF